MYKKIKCIDAQERNKEYPDTFTIPSQEELDGLCSGMWVKVCVSGERFWVKITEVVDSVIRGFIDNSLVNTDDHNLEADDNIEFKKECVFQIMT